MGVIHATPEQIHRQRESETGVFSICLCHFLSDIPLIYRALNLFLMIKVLKALFSFVFCVKCFFLYYFKTKVKRMKKKKLNGLS